MSGQQMSKLTPGHAQPTTDTNTTHVPASKAGLTFWTQLWPGKVVVASTLSWPPQLARAHLYQLRPDVAAPGLVSFRMASCSSPISLGSCLGRGKMLPGPPCRASSASGLWRNSSVYLHPNVQSWLHQ